MHPTVMSFVSGALMALLLVSIWPTSSEATPLYTVRSGRTCDNCHSLPNSWYDPEAVTERKCTLSCAGCHVDPNGGGLRNVSGRYFGESTLALFEFEDRPLDDRPRELESLYGWILGTLTEDNYEPPGEPTSEPTSGPVGPVADHPTDPRPPGSPVPNEGPAFGRPLFHGSSEMAWLDGRYGNMNADPLIQFGGDFRLGYWSPGSLFFPMQADLYTAVHPIEHLTVAATVGARGRKGGFEATADEHTGDEMPVLVKDLWVMTHEWPALSYARAGRFLPAFGWRIDDHTAYTRRPFGLSQEDPGNRVVGGEVGFTGNYPYGNFSLFKPAMGTGNDPLAVDDGWGGAVNFGWRDLGWSLGASAMLRNRPLEQGGDTRDFSLQWGLNPWRYSRALPITYLGEATFGLKQRQFSGKVTEQTAAFHQLSYMPIPGLTLHGRYDFWDPDREIIDDEIHRPGVGAEVVIVPGLTVRADARLGIPAGGTLGEDSTDLFVQLHGWF